MALVSYRTRVNAPIDVLWKHLLEKVETPEKFIPAVTRSEIMGRTSLKTLFCRPRSSRKRNYVTLELP